MATHRAVDTVRRYAAADGSPLGDVAGLGDVVAVAGLTADRDTGDAFAVVDSFVAPTALHRIAPGAGTPRPGPRCPGRRCGPAGAVLRRALLLPVRVLERSRDVPWPTWSSASSTTRRSTGRRSACSSSIAVTSRPGPTCRCILNGYGGFAITETPVWSPQIAAWCAAGGTYAIAGLRGGYEDGEAWHLAGRRALKQNVFDDFHAGADWLVSSALASRERLAVLGRSNGGLLVGVAMTQRPDLCRAVWCGVPLLDMVRFPQFLIARLWTSEYGDPDVAEEFGWLHAYSPYHHVDEHTCYPATLFQTAEGDTRVDPLHARKMAALVQARVGVPRTTDPILLFQEGRAGHGVGKPVAKRADELADGLTFLAWQLGLDAPT